MTKAIKGLKVGEKNTIRISSEVPPGLEDIDRFLQMARVRQQPKDLRVNMKPLKKQLGEEPRVGQEIYAEGPYSAKVVSITGDEVMVRLSARPGSVVDTPFGDGVVRDAADHYETVIDVSVGDLVRSGPVVGRVAHVEEETFSVDYGHPFGEETLICDVVVESAKRPEPEAISVLESTPVQDIKKKLGEALEEARKSGETAVVNLNEDEDPQLVQQGDLVRVNYTATLENGKVFHTTFAQVAKDPGTSKVAWYEEPKEFAPEEVLAGEQGSIPGMGDAILGLAPGEKKRKTLPAEKAYGPSDPRKIAQFSCLKKMPKTMRMTAQEYMEEFNSFPVQGKEVNLVPYFKARVVEVTEHDVKLKFLAEDGEQVKESFGTARITVDEKNVTIRLAPRVGAFFEVKGQKGRITSTEGNVFTVDFNHPLAGKAVMLDLEVVSLTKASAFNSVEIPWLEDHDQGLHAAEHEAKPVVLVLYAEWCTWCKKLLNESFQDPRIKLLKDQFIWVKIDSSMQIDLKKLYEQDGFPMIVLLHPNGEVIRKIEGFKEARTLYQELRQLLKG
jgi:FKBP-type peptidyl-prolyl cis-trans isomerase 2